MLSYLLDKVAYGPEIVLGGLIVSYLIKRIRPWIKSREEMAKSREETGKSRENTARITPRVRRLAGYLLAASLILCAVAVVALVLVALALPQTSPYFHVVRLLAGIALGVFSFVGLLATVGLLALDYVIEVEDRCQKLEDRDKARDERLKDIETRLLSQSRLLEELFPGQQKLPFMSDSLISGRQEEYPS